LLMFCKVCNHFLQSPKVFNSNMSHGASHINFWMKK
jgi:hypothetical protein